MLLIAAGLLVKSFGRLQQVDPGVRTSNLLTFELAIPSAAYPQGEPRARFIAEFHRRVDALPGVVASGAVGALPMGGGGFYLGRTFIREGEPEPPNGPEYSSMWNVITPGFLEATGLQLITGRDFNNEDTKDSGPVVIISQTLAKQMFPNQDPIGKVIRSWRDDNKAPPHRGHRRRHQGQLPSREARRARHSCRTSRIRGARSRTSSARRATRRNTSRPSAPRSRR
jgi:hypothetical protein